MGELDDRQSASAGQFDRQSDRYGRSHILADTSDVDAALEGIAPSGNALALDVATGGGHTALWLARHGWKVTAGDVSQRMLENTSRLLAEEGFQLETRLFPAEEIPFADASFDMVTCRVAAHHFSSPEGFVKEVARVLRPGGYFLLIDGTVPDNNPISEEWLHRVEKWRDPSHGHFLPRKDWVNLTLSNGFTILKSEIHPKKQPDLEWYFETAATTTENRALVREAVATAPAEVRHSLRIGEEEGKTVWWWPILRLVARK
jgi:ubiquinone/menaquinone biosynthesis C-methylase UbiE